MEREVWEIIFRLSLSSSIAVAGPPFRYPLQTMQFAQINKE